MTRCYAYRDECRGKNGGGTCCHTCPVQAKCMLVNLRCHNDPTRCGQASAHSECEACRRKKGRLGR